MTWTPTLHLEEPSAEPVIDVVMLHVSAAPERTQTAVPVPAIPLSPALQAFVFYLRIFPLSRTFGPGLFPYLVGCFGGYLIT